MIFILVRFTLFKIYMFFFLNLYFIPNEFYGFFVTYLDLIIVLSIFFSIFIIISKNPIVSVLHLIILFISISCYLIFLGINFIGLSYLLVYVGAVSILFLFILMLINIRVSELLSNTKNNIPLAILVILALFIPYNNVFPFTKTSLNYYFTNILFVSSNN
jgi:NADH-ubiquinone oxidoreductase chain 6